MIPTLLLALFSPYLLGQNFPLTRLWCCSCGPFDMARIAIVEDNEDTLEMLKVILQNGDEVVGFSDPSVFVDEFRPNHFDLVILDIVMPGRDGLEVFADTRRKDRAVPIMAVTASTHPLTHDELLRAGFCAHFSKPIHDIESFRKIVLGYAGARRKPLNRKSA